jgi:RNA polymerase-binding transcription factor DksA
MAKYTKKKSAAAKRPAAKSKAAGKKPTAKKAVAKKAPPKKATKKAAKKAPAKKATKKAPAKKATVKKAGAKKAGAKKAPTKKATKKTTKKAPAKKATKKATKKAPAKKAAKKASAKKVAKKKTVAKKAPARRLAASRIRVRQRPVRRGNGQPNFRGKKRKYYEMLVTLRDQLVDEVRTLSAQSLTSNKQAGEELADIGSDSFLREMGLGVMSDEGHRIQLIREAIERLNGRGFGVCLDCSEHIQEARLEAIPYAKLCVQCKTRRETARAEGIDLDAELELTE